MTTKKTKAKPKLETTTVETPTEYELEIPSFFSEDEFTLDSANDELDFSVFDEELESTVEIVNNETKIILEEQSNKSTFDEVDRLFEIAVKAIDKACHEQELYLNSNSDYEKEYHYIRMKLALSIYFRNYTEIKLIQIESRKKEARSLDWYKFHDKDYQETFTDFKVRAKKVQDLKKEHDLGLTDYEELEFIIFEKPFKKTESKDIISELLSKSDKYFEKCK